MKKIYFVVLFSSLLIVKGFSILPPFYQSKKEIEHLLNDEDLHEKLGSGEYISDIIRNKDGWTVITTKYLLKVKVVYLPNEMIGPSRFHFEYGELIERK